jgi:two-component system NtrC family sensor kinase
MPWDHFVERIYPGALVRNPSYRPLIRNIVVTIITVSLVPMVLVSSTLYIQFRDSFREKVNDHLGELLHKHQQNIDNFLQERLTDIRLMAVRYGHERLKDPEFLQRNLRLLQQEYGNVFVDLGVVDGSGNQEAYAGPFKLARAFYGEAPWFREVLRGEFVVSDVFLGLRGLPHFIVAVRSVEGGVPWVLRATIDFVAFNTLVDGIRIGRTGFAFILNREGVLQTTPASRPYAPGITDSAYAKNLWKAFANVTGDIRILRQPDADGRDNIFAGTFLKGGEWLLIYQQSAADAFADLDRSFAVTTILMALGTAAVVIMALALSRRMVQRIARIDEEKKLMNEKVVETGKLASIGELAAGVAHEINNPVAIMVEEAGWIGDLLAEEEFAESRNLAEFKRALEQIRTQGRRCKEITHKLLSFARKTSEKIQEIQVNELLQELLAISAQRAKYSLVEVDTRFADGLPPVRMPVAELQQVFLNLINNALDAMENRGGRLTLSTRLENGFVVTEVSDTGAGIPAPYLHRIFDPFFTTKAVGKGTGLGLSICYGIVNKAGGRIEVQSTVEVGSTFSVFLPAAAAPEPQTGP